MEHARLSLQVVTVCLALLAWRKGSAQAACKVTEGGAGDGYYLGHSLALDGDTLLLAAYGYNEPVGGCGKAFVYVRSGTNWVRQAGLQHPSPASSDFFGASVGLVGDTAVIGANAVDVPAVNCGAAYVFERTGTNWQRTAVLQNEGVVASDFLGFSSAISGDDIIVGATGADIGATRCGVAYVFVRDGTNWAEQARLVPQPVQAGVYGACAVDVEGDRAFMGSRDHDTVETSTGALYVYDRSGTNWSFTTRLAPLTLEYSDNFGCAVDAVGDTVMIGAYGDDDAAPDAGAVYVYAHTGSAWALEAKLLPWSATNGMHFGRSVHFDGSQAVIGAPCTDSGTMSGYAYTFTRNGTNWTPGVRLAPHDGEAGDRFGYSVGASGGSIAAGAPYEDEEEWRAGAAYVFSVSPPDSACSPAPASGASGVTRTPRLNWVNGTDTQTIDLYFGTSTQTWTKVLDNVPVVTAYSPGTLAYSQTYFWRVDCRNGNGTTRGPSWRFTTEAQPRIDIERPNGGETWYSGRRERIAWDSVNAGDSVSIELYFDDGRSPKLVETIADKTDNDGAYDWDVPLGLRTGFVYLVRIADTTVPGLEDWSDQVFCIAESFLTVTAPNGGEMWCVEARYPVTWDCVGGGGNVRIDIFDRDVFLQTIVASTPNDGSFDWVIDHPYAGADNRIRVTDLTYERLQDQSDAPFTILTAAPSPPDGPTPPDKMVDISPLTALHWQNGSGTTSLDLYLDTRNPPARLVLDNVPAITAHQPSPCLDWGQNYHWQVVARNGFGETAGPIWTFRTVPWRDPRITSVVYAAGNVFLAWDPGTCTNPMWAVMVSTNLCDGSFRELAVTPSNVYEHVRADAGNGAFYRLVWTNAPAH